MKPLDKSHLNQVLKLSNTAFGNNFLTLTYLKKYINSSIHLGIVLEKNNQIIGFSLIDILSPKELKDVVLLDKYWFYSITKAYNKIALRKQTLVNPQFKGLGYGSKLVKLSSNLIQTKTEMEISILWIKNDINPMAKILLKNDFKPIKTIPNYWYNNSITKKYVCSICGLPPCKCFSEVYIKKALTLKG